jgi:hypothetical protein
MTKQLDIQIKPFKEQITSSLGHLLPPKLISTLANMLAIDFATRQTGQPIDTQISYYIQNLLRYITTSTKKFDDSFASATILFSVAITPPKDNHDIKSINQLQNKEEVASVCVEACMPEINLEEKDSMKDALKILLDLEHADSLINFITDDPKLVSAINAKYVEKIRKIRAHIIANEISVAHAKKLNITDSNMNHLNLMQSLVKDLSGHVSNKEYNPRELAALTKVVGLERGA